MKKNIFINGILFLTTLFFASCQSTSKVPDATADEYNSKTEITDTSTDKNNEQRKKIQTPKKSIFTYGNKGEYLTIGETTIFVKGTFGKFGQKDASFVIRIEDEQRGIGHSYAGGYYFSLFTENGINLIKAAYAKYLDDFENKRLDRKSKKTLKAYGAIPVTLRWGAFSNSTPHNGIGKAQLGYTFIENSPYFTITVEPVHNKYYDLVGESAMESSNNYTIYMTKAQVRNYLDNLAPDIIDSYLYESPVSEETQEITETSDNY